MRDFIGKATDSNKQQKAIGCHPPSTILQQEKQHIAYPTVTNTTNRKQRKQNSASTSSPVVFGASTNPTIPTLRGLGKNAGRQSSPDTDDSPAQEYFEDEKKGREKNPSYVSYLDETFPSKDNPSYVSYLDESRPCKENPSYASYLDESPNIYNPLPADDIEAMPMPTPPMSNDDDVVPQQHRPGAYAQAPGSNLQRLDQLSFSVIGVQPELLGQVTMEDDSSQHLGSGSSSNDQRNSRIIRDNYEDDTTREDRALGHPTLPNLDNDGLVEALPVSTSFYSSSRWIMAQPVDQQEAVRREAQEKNRRFVSLAVFVIIVCLVLIGLSLFGVQATREEEESISTDVLEVDDETSTDSPTKPLPTMENLELLYEELPQKTKDSLYNSDSHQYRAWEWLLNHPNITAYPTWRKKQIFAMATIFYSFEGPNWPEKTPARKRWMNVSISECDWMLSPFEVAMYIYQAHLVIGPNAYKEQDWQSCDQDGKIQTLVLHQLSLPTNLKPSIPPEIGLLSTSLKIIGIMFNRINAELSDLLVPELIQLPNLEALNFREGGAHGSIPKEISLMTGLRHLLIGANGLTGTIPSEIASMTYLEYFGLGDEEGINGQLPSGFGLMTRLTGLEIYRCSVTGTIPTSLGMLSNMKTLALDGNLLGGSIPSNLGLLTANTRLELEQNHLNGSIPPELGLMTNTVHLELWNNALTGSIPTQLLSMANVVEFRIGNELASGSQNNFTGSIPMALWELSHMETLILPNLPNLHGIIPTAMMMPNLTKLSLSGSPGISGTIPDQACLFVDELNFDCSDLLCGCDCHCAGRW